jgi:hypothetical protein
LKSNRSNTRHSIRPFPACDSAMRYPAREKPGSTGFQDNALIPVGD